MPLLSFYYYLMPFLFCYLITSLKSTNLMSNNLLGGFKVQVTFIQMY